MDVLHGYFRIIGYKDAYEQLSINYYDFFEFDLCTNNRECNMEEFSSDILTSVEEAISEIIDADVGIGELWELIGEVKENDSTFYIGQHEYRICTVQDLIDAFNKPTLETIYRSMRDGTTLKAA